MPVCIFYKFLCYVSISAGCLPHNGTIVLCLRVYAVNTPPGSY